MNAEYLIVKLLKDTKQRILTCININVIIKFSLLKSLTFSNLEFNNGGRRFRAGVNANGNSYIQTIFPSGTIQQLEIKSDGAVESVFFDGSTWGLNWSSENSNNSILFDGDCNALGFGLYICEGNVKNIPDVNWYMIISAVSGGTGVQLGIALFGKNIRVRSIASGVWEKWSRINI